MERVEKENKGELARVPYEKPLERSSSFRNIEEEE